MGKKLLHNFSSLLGFFLLGLSLWAIASELRQYDYRDVFKSLAAIPTSRLYWAIGLTILSYLGLANYDSLAFRYIGHALAYPKSVFTGFISAAATNTVGFAFLTGSAIRYRLYSAWGVPAIAIAQIILFENISFWLGLFAVSGVMFLFYPLEIPTQLHLPFISVRPIGLIFLLVVAGYLVGSLFARKPLNIRGHEFRFPSLQIALAQVAISGLDWICATAVLYILLPATTALSYPGFLGLYLLAMTAGVVSNVPGGLGVFESIILLLLSSKVSVTAVLGSLLVYRGIYYLLPLVVATGLLGLYEILSRWKVRSP
ncbi:lysylphosphatidylglycerol synthase domain-containing protein [Allocoleopsis sp.]|uniref:lysylphosphatidylglycerol synthase domain-containing protein n=1 Tax=Allocoleopsis sp. TaxID=3088169 RepID=UPI002FD5284D